MHTHRARQTQTTSWETQFSDIFMTNGKLSIDISEYDLNIIPLKQFRIKLMFFGAGPLQFISKSILI